MVDLRPWYHALRGLPFLPNFAGDDMNIEPDRRVLWLRLRLYEATTPNHEVVEGVSLLNRLASADSEAWRREVAVIWDRNCDTIRRWIKSERNDSLQRNTARPWRFGLALILDRNGTDLDRVRSCQPSDAFAESLRRIEALPCDRERVPSDSDVVLLRCEVETAQALTHTLSSACGQLPPPSTGSLRTHIDAVRIAKPSVCWPPKPGLVETILYLCEEHVRMVDLPLLTFNDNPNGSWKRLDTAANSRATVHGLRTLLRLPTLNAAEDDATAEPSSVAYVSVTDECGQFIPACLSAFQEATSIQSLRVSLDKNVRRMSANQVQAHLQNWRLLAFSIFSEYASHSISSLTLSVEWFDKIVYDEVARVLAHPDPLQAVYQVPQETRDAFPKQITATTFFLFDQTLSEEDQKRNGINCHKAKMCYRSEHMIAVYVIEGPLDEKKPWWRVLLPGWGPAWVHQDSDMSIVADGLLSRRSPRPRFRSISLEGISRHSGDSTLNLLRLIGQYTERVDVEMQPLGPSSGDWYRQLASTCPNLAAFNVISDENVSLQAFAEAAESGEGKLKRLSLRSVVPMVLEGFEGFFSALWDPTHPLAVHLQELSMNLYVTSAMVPALVVHLQSLLQLNRTLYMIDIVVRLRGVHHGNPCGWTAIKNLMHDPVYVLSVPLEWRKKLALLSALSHEGSAPYLHRLDSNIVAIIFQFAATALVRDASIITRG